MLNESGINPVHFNVVVKLDKVEEKTAGGIILPDAVKTQDKLAAEKGVLVAVSPLAFGYASPDEWGEAKKPTSGDRVLFARYSGTRREVNGQEYVILKDDAIIAVEAA